MAGWEITPQDKAANSNDVKIGRFISYLDSVQQPGCYIGAVPGPGERRTDSVSEIARYGVIGSAKPVITPVFASFCLPADADKCYIASYKLNLLSRIRRLVVQE